MQVNGTTQNNNQPSPLRKTAGITAGTVIAASPSIRFIKKLTTPLTDEGIKKRQKKLGKFIQEIAPFETIKNYAENILSETSLKNKGVKLSIWSKENVAKLKPIKDLSTLEGKMQQKTRQIYSNGLNASFDFQKNTVNINDKLLYSAVFHEIGHSADFHSKATLPLFILRIISQLSTVVLPIIPLTLLNIGFFGSNKKKAQENKTEKSNKATNFIHNNAGKLTFLCFSPVIAEEALASLRGLKFAKKYLTPEQNSIHVKNQMKALSTYALTGVIISAAVALGIYVKDKIVGNKKVN